MNEKPAAPKPELTEELAAQIRDLAAATQKLLSGPVKPVVIHMLLAHDTGLARRKVAEVLDAAATLDRYLTKKK